MKPTNLISVGDFLDLYYKIRSSGLIPILNRFYLTKKQRIQKTWETGEVPPTNWRSIPRILRRFNFLITGDPAIEFPDYVCLKYFSKKNFLRAVSPGCGTGLQEIKFARYSCFCSIEAFDTSRQSLLKASEKAKTFGLTNIRFFVEDVNHFDFGTSIYDMILFNGSLHHFENLESLFLRVKKGLAPEGLLIVNEYVGPSRFQWNEKQLQVANALLKKIPVEYRKKWNSGIVKKKQYRPGLLRMILYDPSEAVESENILPLLQRHFKTLEIKNLGGNLLRLILKDIAHHFMNEDGKTNRILDDLFAAEDEFLKENPSDFIFGVFQKTTSSDE